MRALMLALAHSALAAADASATPDALVGTAWRVERLGGTRLAAHDSPTIRFGANSASGFSGCNVWRARAPGEERVLSFQEILVAKQKCRGGPDALEADFLRALRRTQRAQRVGERLVLIDIQGRETMRLMR